MSFPSTKTALIADDTELARTAVVRRLSADGVSCVEASSAAAATAIDPSTICCALLDLDLGDGNGVDVAVALQKRAPGLRVAFFTAGSSPDILARATALAPVFGKPDDLERAVAWVKSCAAGA